MATEKRLIDARFLTSQMYMICEVCDTENIFIDAIIDEIDNAPDVYAVEVVRRKDCKHMEVTPDCLRWCNVWCGINGMGDEGFCNYGERKDNG